MTGLAVPTILRSSTRWWSWVVAALVTAAIAVGWVYYVAHFISRGGGSGRTLLLALIGLWLAAAINLAGMRNVGIFQSVTLALRLTPWVLIVTLSLVFVHANSLTPWNTSDGISRTAISGALVICVVSYLGTRTAAVAAAKVRDPRRSLPRSTVYGTTPIAAVYVLCLIAAFVLIPAGGVVFGADGATHSADSGNQGGVLLAIVVLVCGIGALNGWMLTTVALYPRDPTHESARTTPISSIIATAAFASIAVMITWWAAVGGSWFIA